MERIPFVCDAIVIWKSIDSFHQNNMRIAPLIYKTVGEQIHASIIDGGGSSSNSSSGSSGSSASGRYPNTIIAIGGDLTTYLLNYWIRFSSEIGRAHV